MGQTVSVGVRIGGVVMIQMHHDANSACRTTVRN